MLLGPDPEFREALGWKPAHIFGCDSKLAEVPALYTRSEAGTNPSKEKTRSVGRIAMAAMQSPNEIVVGTSIVAGAIE